MTLIRAYCYHHDPQDFQAKADAEEGETIVEDKKEVAARLDSDIGDDNRPGPLHRKEETSHSTRVPILLDNGLPYNHWSSRAFNSPGGSFRLGSS